jgi:hypothetical protein
VLRENAAMLHVFKNRYPNATSSVSGGSDVTIVMDFGKARETTMPSQKNDRAPISD